MFKINVHELTADITLALMIGAIIDAIVFVLFKFIWWIAGSHMQDLKLSVWGWVLIWLILSAGIFVFAKAGEADARKTGWNK